MGKNFKYSSCMSLGCERTAIILYNVHTDGKVIIAILKSVHIYITKDPYFAAE